MTTATIAATPTFEKVLDRCRPIAQRWAEQRADRMHRASLDRSDFDELRDAGVPLMAVPVDFGGAWSGVRRSTRPICEILRTLATGDPSVALVNVMHPASLQDHLTIREAPEPYRAAWAVERAWIFESIRDGAWWGPMGSEPGKSSDRAPVQGTARKDPDGVYRLSGRKHFATGSGINTFAMTSAIPEGETEPSTFYLDLRGMPFDGSAGIRLVAPWDGYGMTATQSHSFELVDFPAVRSVLPAAARPPQSPFFPCAYTAVVLGVVETALDAARTELKTRHGDLGPYEHTEWRNAGLDAWLMRQAFEGMLRAVEQPSQTLGLDLMRGKIAAGQLAESAMTRICRVIGARTFSRSSTFGAWFEDVRALGFLRPGWRTAYDAVDDLAEPLEPAP